MKTVNEKSGPEVKEEKVLGLEIDPRTREIIGESEEAKNAYLDYLLFSQS